MTQKPVQKEDLALRWRAGSEYKATLRFMARQFLCAPGDIITSKALLLLSLKTLVLITGAAGEAGVGSSGVAAFAFLDLTLLADEHCGEVTLLLYWWWELQRDKHWHSDKSSEISRVRSVSLQHKNVSHKSLRPRTAGEYWKDSAEEVGPGADALSSEKVFFYSIASSNHIGPLRLMEAMFPSGAQTNAPQS